jgi:hypothetical protein
VSQQELAALLGMQININLHNSIKCHSLQNFLCCRDTLIASMGAISQNMISK